MHTPSVRLFLQGDQEIPEALNSDFSFRLSYEYSYQSMLADARIWLQQIWLILPLIAVLWLPGRFLIRLFKFDGKLDWIERIAVSIGLSMAVVPIVFLWTTTIGLHWTRTGLFIILALVAVTYLILEKDTIIPKIKLVRRANGTRNNIIHLMMVIILIIALATRLAMVRDLATPAWVDSVHHATITRMILDEGAIPSSYAPYIEVNTASYHAGFHSIAAMFQGISGIDLAQGMLIFGQVLNALMVFAAYLFTTTLTNRKLAGIIAALITGLLTPMPAYYTSWGRYTQLAGLLILPVAYYFFNYISETGNSQTEEKLTGSKLIIGFILVGISMGGLLLVHYRVAAFLGALIVVYYIVSLVKFWKLKTIRTQLTKQITIIFITSIITIILTIPWWPSTLRSFNWTCIPGICYH